VDPGQPGWEIKTKLGITKSALSQLAKTLTPSPSRSSPSIVVPRGEQNGKGKKSLEKTSSHTESADRTLLEPPTLEKLSETKGRVKKRGERGGLRAR